LGLVGLAALGVVAAVARMADGTAASQSPILLADVLNRLAVSDRWAVVQQLHDGIADAKQVAQCLQAAETAPDLTLRHVEVHLLAAICHLELAAGALGLDPLKRAPSCRSWQRWLWWWR
jgi:hypothetical protein